MTAKLNLKEWKAMENCWVDAMLAGKDVKIEVKALYNGSSKRPERFRVIQNINGQEKVFNFVNE